ncbi:hypothetical protein F5X98DRAFT_239072 [Xylaria grammica]|nr:hypothetical protein F5X98DRAFT_239072 [Xylaria grammica]
MLHPAPQLGTSSVLGIVEAYFHDDLLRLDRPALNLLPVGDGDIYRRGDRTIYRVRHGEEGQMEVDTGRNKIVLGQSTLQRRVVQLISSNNLGDIDSKTEERLGNYRILLRPIFHKSPSSHYEHEVLCPQAHGNWIYAKHPHELVYYPDRLIACVLLKGGESHSNSPELVVLILESLDDLNHNMLHVHLVELQKWIGEGDMGCDIHRLESMADHLRTLYYYQGGGPSHPRSDEIKSYFRDLESRYGPKTGASVSISSTRRVRAWIAEGTFIEDKVYHLHVEVD